MTENALGYLTGCALLVALGSIVTAIGIIIWLAL